MKGQRDIDTLKVLMDGIIEKLHYPVNISEVLDLVLGMKYGKETVFEITHGEYVTEDTKKTIEELIELLKFDCDILYELFEEAKNDSNYTEEDIEEAKIEWEKFYHVIIILKSIIDKNMVYHEEDEKKDIIFITLEDPNKKGTSIIEKDISDGDEKVVLESLERMEELATSQILFRNKFDIRAHGNGFHNHSSNKKGGVSHTIYKNVGAEIRIQIRRAGKDGDVIAVIAISPPSEVHRNSRSEDARTALYDEREEMLEDFLKSCQRDENGVYIVSSNELDRLQQLYEQFKEKLKQRIAAQTKSPNITALDNFRKKVEKNYQDRIGKS